MSAFSILILGDAGVGKTSLAQLYARPCLYRFSGEEIAGSHKRNGMDFIFRRVKLGPAELRVEISWNAASHNPIQKCFYQQARGVAVVFDITSRSSFDNVAAWKKQIDDNASASVVKFLIGNKLDLAGERKVSTEDAIKVAGELEMTYYEASIKKKDKVEEMLFEMIRKIQDESFTSDKVTVILKSGYVKKKTTCC
eukprot:TRINITY_DN5790_c0_g2_i14.p1 TRINITY_DN5790_c0_g2~~TRINITY_DN5790_c0_g2_i14.p1  ORF type:complete len:196 (-),score=47.69 TRINITY_DN5790_c0_g2_i14:102-689(-)